MSMYKVEKNLQPEHLGVTGLNSFAMHNSASRGAMFSNHFAQRLVTKHCDEKIIQSGLEKEFARHTFSVKMPENGRIVKIIERYPRSIAQNSINFNPETIIIYENEVTREIDYFSIPHYCSNHQYFGFKYQTTDNINKLKPGAYIPKDMIFADSPSVSENGGFNYGINLNVAFMSKPGVAEDGFEICEDVLDKFKYNLYETRSVEFGAKAFPLNMFGSKTDYKPFKEIGEYLDESGLLMMLRDYDQNLSVVDCSVFDTMEPDYTFDRATYVRGGKGRIVDIRVISNNSKNKNLPEEMCKYLDKYEKALQDFYKELLNAEAEMRYQHRRMYENKNLAISPKLHRLLVEAYAVTNYQIPGLNQPLNLMYKKNMIDEYRIDFVIEYEMDIGVGNKLTDVAGGLNS